MPKDIKLDRTFRKLDIKGHKEPKAPTEVSDNISAKNGRPVGGTRSTFERKLAEALETVTEYVAAADEMLPLKNDPTKRGSNPSKPISVVVTDLGTGEQSEYILRLPTSRQDVSNIMAAVEHKLGANPGSISAERIREIAGDKIVSATMGEKPIQLKISNEVGPIVIGPKSDPGPTGSGPQNRWD